MNRTLAWLAGFISVACLLFILSPALARDPDGLYDNSPYKGWFESQKNAAGQYCCNQSDGHPYLDDYSMNDDGGVTLQNGDKLPSYMVLKGANNPTGHAVIWFIETSPRTYYCFAPGSFG